MTEDDIRNITKIIAHPDSILFGTEAKSGRNMFFFKKNADGTYNLAEVYGDRKGNLTAKSFYNTKKEASQRVMEIKRSLLPTSVTYSGATPSSDAKIPNLFETTSVESEEFADNELFRDDTFGRPTFEESITQGKLLYADKEKIQTLIDQQRRTLAEVDYLDLNSVAKIIKGFANPSIDGKENVKELFRDDTFGRPIFEKSITQALVKLAMQNKDNVSRRLDAMREDRNVGNGVHAYEVTKIGVLDETPNTPNGTDGLNSELEASSAVAKLLQNVGKSYEKEKISLARSSRPEWLPAPSKETFQRY